MYARAASKAFPSVQMSSTTRMVFPCLRGGLAYTSPFGFLIGFGFSRIEFNWSSDLPVFLRSRLPVILGPLCAGR